MTNIKISQLNVLLQAFTTLVISCFLLKIIDGQDWPIIIDPFPDADVIGPEPPPTPPPTPDCTYACQARIDDAMVLISQVQQQLLDTNSTLLSRIILLESRPTGQAPDPALTQRVTNLENYLPANVSMLMAKINSDIDTLRKSLRDEVALLRQDLEAKIAAIPVGGGDSGKAMEVYLNLTQRINGLENGKIQNLINDNNLWRQNFRIVNATFAKLKKSAFSNNVVVNG